MKEREILFENRYEVDREVYDRWRRLGLVQSRGALFFRFVWAGLLVLVVGDFFRNLFFGAGFRWCCSSSSPCASTASSCCPGYEATPWCAI